MRHREPTASEHRRPALPTKRDTEARTRAEERNERGGEQISAAAGDHSGSGHSGTNGCGSGVAVVTGIGVVAPTGIGTTEHWETTLRGEVRVGPIEEFDATRYGTTLAGRVPGFGAAGHVEDRLAVQTDRWTHLALTATSFALADAGYDPAAHDPYDTAVVLASGSGGNAFGQREIQALWQRGRRAVGAYQSIAWFYAASTGQVSIRHRTKGPSGVLVSEGAGGLDSLGQARRVVRRGTPAVLAGGTEAPLSPYALACQATGGRLSTGTDPRAAYKPFDRRAGGHVPGEGGAVLLVEDLDRARARGVGQVYGEIAGYGATHDAHHPQEAPPDATQYARAMSLALADAGLAPSDVDLVVADAAGTPELDLLEAQALNRVFGPGAVPVTAPSGLVGRLCSGGAALNVATALLAMRDSLVPAVGNLDDPDPAYGLDLVCGGPRRMPVRVVLVCARGQGGFNSALVLRAARTAQATGSGGAATDGRVA